MLRVVIVDDQFIISEGIQYLIERDNEISVVGLASNGKEAFELCEQLQPDVVLMDIVMPNYNGVIGTKMII
jgi:YesN/AraC family two-component response regulator